MTRHLPCLLIAACLLTGCETGTDSAPTVTAAPTQNAPPGATPGTCWEKDTSPAIVETVTEQVLVRPPTVASDGSTTEPGVYRTETRQKIVQERQEIWFETPCADVLTPMFVETLQRALAARGHYRGPITGQLDTRTRVAIRRYQKPEGLNSETLSLIAAREMGLIRVEPF